MGWMAAKRPLACFRPAVERATRVTHNESWLTCRVNFLLSGARSPPQSIHTCTRAYPQLRWPIDYPCESREYVGMGGVHMMMMMVMIMTVQTNCDCVIMVVHLPIHGPQQRQRKGTRVRQRGRRQGPLAPSSATDTHACALRPSHPCQ
jgi:hypothetical protein